MSTVSMATVPLRDEVFAANRAIGRIALTVAAGAGRSRPARVHESGSLRVRFPHRDGAALDAVIVNTGGGMTGGDRFELDINVGAGADVGVTTAAAEKIYRSLGPDTVLDVNLTVGPGGRLAWLPQETILFDRARLRRKIDVDLAPDASLLLAEASIFGRSAMGETVLSGSFFDRWRVRVGGSLVFADAIRLEGPIAQSLAMSAAAAGGAAVASVLKVPGTEECVAAVRALQQDFTGEVGASAWNGLVAVRCVAADNAVLRHDLAKVLAALGSGPLPRLWTN
jgi:urease accessory protein